MKIHKTKIPIYFGRLIIVFSDDFKKVIEQLKLDTKGRNNLDEYGSFAMSQRNKNGVSQYFMILCKKADNTIVAHEALHITNWILNDRHIQADFVNDETQAYLLGWVVSQVDKAKHKLKK